VDVDLLILGCGSSSGTPAIGCACPTCASPDPKNRRTRASAVLCANGVNFLIDTGPDLRQQALREGLRQVDAVLYTHPHADHLNGIDDLRAFCYLRRGAIPLFGSRFMMDNIRERFGYALHAAGPQWDKPVLETHAIDGPFSYAGVTVTPIPVLHGQWPILGWRIGDVAYLTDISSIPDTSWPLLAGVRLLLLDCLRMTPYPSHLSFTQALELAARLAAPRTVLIHMTHELEYHALSAQCPPGVEVGYDGMHVHS
jgi:phosphoribosyl 1,2-cyclic phosphate phosphodiesterase